MNRALLALCLAFALPLRTLRSTTSTSSGGRSVLIVGPDGTTVLLEAEE